MIYAERIRRKLTEGLTPQRLEIDDDSARHAGHAGHDPAGETHFNVLVVSAAFEGRGRIERQRMVYALLSDEMKERVHALSVVTRAPSEDV